jgi:predicted DNA-binding protein (MmcQ/YjbR family)
MGWISVLNPSTKTFEKMKPLIQEAHEFSKEKFMKRK